LKQRQQYLPRRFCGEPRSHARLAALVADAKPDYLLIIAIAATVVLLLVFAISLLLF
jgi:hypothetical protein